MTVDMVNELDNRNHRNGSSHAGDNLQLSLVQHLRAGGQLRIAILTLVRCEHCHNALDEVFANVAGVRVTRLAPDDLESEDASYHISIVIGHARSSIDVQALNLLRNKSDKMIAVGTCSTSTGIRALRAFRNITPFLNLLNISEDVLANLDSGSASAEHVEIDFEVLGCPINPQRATDIITALILNKRPPLLHHNLCHECKRAGVICVLIARNEPCVGPVTVAGCGALCPAHGYGCWGCFGAAPECSIEQLERVFKQRGITGHHVDMRVEFMRRTVKARG